MKQTFCTLLNEKYILPFKVFSYTLFKHNPDFLNYDYHVIDMGDITDKSKEELSSKIRNIKFKKVNLDLYEGIKTNTKWRTWEFNVSYRYEIFDLEEYDKIIFLDSDTIVLKSMPMLLEYNGEFAACKIVKGSSMDHPNGDNSFDGGLMIIGKKYINQETKNKLIEISLEKDWTSDEPVLNKFFTKVDWLPQEYNLLTPECDFNSLKKCRMLQYVGHKKPWDNTILLNRYDTFIKVRAGIEMVKHIDKLYQKCKQDALFFYE